MRALPRGTALLLATGAKAAMVELLPWYEGPDAGRIGAEAEAAEAALAERAVATATAAPRP